HVRSAENEEMQPSLPLGCNIEFCVHQQTAQVRIADDHLVDGVAPIRVRIGDLKTQAERAEAVEVGCHVAALIVEEGFAIGDQKLQVADLRSVNGGVI